VAKKYDAREMGDTHRYLPEDLTLVTDKLSPVYDPRVHWEAEEELAEDILEHGQLVPVILRQNGRHPGVGDAAGKARMEVVDGRRRVKAIGLLVARARANGVAEEELPLVECVVKRQTNDDTTAMSAISAANEHRRATPPSMRAEMAARMEDRGMSQEAIGRALNTTPKGVAQLLALASLDQKSKSAIDSDVLPLWQATALARLSSEERAPLIDAAQASPRAQALARKAVAETAAARSNPSRPTPVRTHRTKREIEAHLAEVRAQLAGVRAEVDAGKTVGHDGVALSLSLVALSGVVGGLEWALGLRGDTQVKP
jgi:ParB-like chromosome segregation protein Spo0J